MRAKDDLLKSNYKIQKMESATYWIEKLEMKPHPEGGFCKEMYRPEHRIHLDQSGCFPDNRRVLTTIYYLLENQQVSTFHRIKSPESWFFHIGTPLLIYSIHENGTIACQELSDHPSGDLQVTIEPNTWFAARLKVALGYTLVSCAVAPGFEYEDFTLADREILINKYPQHRDLINSFYQTI